MAGPAAAQLQPLQRILGATAGLMASTMLLLKAPLLVPAVVAGVLALAWGSEWRTWNNHAAALGGMLLLRPGVGWHLGMPTSEGAKRSGCGVSGAGRVLLDAGEGSDLGWRVPVIEVLEGGWPWLPLVPFALIGHGNGVIAAGADGPSLPAHTG